MSAEASEVLRESGPTPTAGSVLLKLVEGTVSVEPVAEEGEIHEAFSHGELNAHRAGQLIMPGLEHRRDPTVSAEA